MKKYLILIMLILFTSGCVNINTCEIDDIIKSSVTSNRKIYNTYRTGYKFYLPRGTYVENSSGYNEVIKSGDSIIYLYFDIIGYLNKNVLNYKKKSDCYLSQEINYKDKKGYIEINKINSKYLVEIVYNYAKIEVMVNELSINKILADSISILSSIKYNRVILENVSKNNILNYNETPIDIFNSKNKDNSNLLEYNEEYDEENIEDVIPDYDTIN